MRILVTGGNGLVGSAIKTIADKYNYEFIFTSSIQCDLTNWEQTINYFEIIKPYFVIHLAANVGGLFKNLSQKVDMFEYNLLININVLRASHQLKVKKLIACLSTCIFPDKTTYPIDETMVHLGPPHYSNETYAYSKRMLEINCKAYREQYGDNFICVIPTNIYGPNDNFNLLDAHVIPALIHKCYLAVQSNEQFEVSGSGKPLRQFIYSEDLAILIMLVLEKYNDSESIILSTSDEISIGDISKIIAKKFNYTNKLVFNTLKSDGQFKKTASNAKLINLIDNNFKFTEINNGLEITIDWFYKNYNCLRK
jgi:GDP-L-fucose synthase